MMSLECKRGKSMNDLGKSIDSMVEQSKAEVKPTIPQKPAAPKPEISEKAAQNPKESPLDSLYKKSKEKNLFFERMLLNDIMDNPDKYNEFDLGNRKYKRNGNAFDMYEDGRHIWTGTYSSAANSVNDYYEKNNPEAKEAEAYYKEAGDIIGKNAIAGKDLLEGVDKDRFEAAKKVLSRNARGLGNIESQYIDLMNKGWKQQDVEAELAKRGFSKDDIKNAYGEVRYGERYKDWKGNDNYVDASKYQISKKNPIDVKNANMFKSEEDYKAFITPLIKDRIAEYKKAGMDNKTMLAELNDEFGYKDLISQALSDFDKTNPNYNPYAHELKKATNYDDYEKLVDEYYKNLNDADYRKGLDSNRRKILESAFNDMDFKENKEGRTIGEFISANDLVNKYPKDEDYIKAVEPFLKEVGDAYHSLDPNRKWTPRDELTELAHYYRRHPKPVFEKAPELTREEKIANLKERFKNEPEKLRLINDLLPLMEELFK